MDRIRITDVLRDQYEDFLSYCQASGKEFVSDLTSADFADFRQRMDRTREYVRAIKAALGHPTLSGRGNPSGADEPDAPPSPSGGPVAADVPASVKDPASDRSGAAAEAPRGGAGQGTDERAGRAASAEGTVRAPQDLAGASLASSRRGGKLPLSAVFGVDGSAYQGIGIEALGLGTRPANCLMNAKLRTVAEVLEVSTGTLRSIHNMGVKSVEEVLRKVRDYVSDPTNARPGLGLAGRPRILSPAFEEAVVSMLADRAVPTETMSGEQLAYFERLREAAEAAGKEICLEAFADPAYSRVICDMLRAYAAPYAQFLHSLRSLQRKTARLTDRARTRRARPFMRAYAAKAKPLSSLMSLCDDRTTIAQLPALYESLGPRGVTPALTGEAGRFLDWLDFDVRASVAAASRNILDGLVRKNHRFLEVIALRSQGQTLGTIGARYGITKERVRQMEKTARRILWNLYSKQKYDLIMLAYALADGDNFLPIGAVLETVGEDLGPLLWLCLQHDGEHRAYYYSKTFNAVIIRTGRAELDDEAALRSRVDDALAGLPDVIEAPEKERLLRALSEARSIPPSMLRAAFDETYRRTKDFFHKGRLGMPFMCQYVLKTHFREGYKIANRSEADRFRRRMVELFGNQMEQITDRAIDAKIADVGILCDRGKYLHPDFLNVEPRVIHAVNDYIERSPRQLLPYGEIFEAMRDMLKDARIANKYLLQGALKKYGCRFSTGRNFIRKTPSASIVEELDAFVERRGVVHKSEIFAEFLSLGETGLGQIVARSDRVFNIDNGYYIHASQFSFRSGDYAPLRAYLTEACREIPVNIRTVYETVSARFPEFMSRNALDDKSKLFAALRCMFPEEFAFSRPYVARRGSEDVTNRSVILRHIEGLDRLEIPDLIRTCNEHNIRFVSLTHLCQLIAPDFARVSRTTMMRRALTGVTGETIDQAADILTEELARRGYIVGSKVADFSRFPPIRTEWTPFLLEHLMVHSGRIPFITIPCDPLRRPYAVYVGDEFRDDAYDTFLVKVLTEKVRAGAFASKVAMRDWLRQEELIECKLPNFLTGARYFYVGSQGVRCAGE